MKRITIEYKLNHEVELPQEFIDSVPRQGPADEAIKELQEDFNVECDEKELVEFLKRYGAWDDEELQDHGANIDRLIWLSCLDCQENKTTHFYMGE